MLLFLVLIDLEEELGNQAIKQPGKKENYCKTLGKNSLAIN